MLALLSDFYHHAATFLLKEDPHEEAGEGMGGVSVAIERGRPPEMGSACFSQWRLMDKV